MESTEGVRVAVCSKVAGLVSYSLVVFRNSSSMSYAQSRSAGRLFQNDSENLRVRFFCLRLRYQLLMAIL